jgi:hypothetical protein
MEKKIFAFLLFIFLSSCGYEAVYSVKNRVNYSFSINELTLAGDRQVNLRIKQRLKKYTNPDTEKQKIFSLKISSKSEKIITAKDASGDAIKFKNELTINAQVFMNDEYRTNLVIIENFIYDNNSDTFELRAYENQIKNNLAGTAVDKILTKLANIL